MLGVKVLQLEADMKKDQTSFEHFEKLDIRVGTVISAEPASTKKPTYRMKIDFGGEIGTKTSCGAYTNYLAGELVGKQIIGVVNFAPMKMGSELSEVLVLGVHAPTGEGTIFLTTERAVANGEAIF
jgi:tRNA-binding protein